MQSRKQNKRNAENTDDAPATASRQDEINATLADADELTDALAEAVPEPEFKEVWDMNATELRELGEKGKDEYLAIMDSYRAGEITNDVARDKLWGTNGENVSQALEYYMEEYSCTC